MCKRLIRRQNSQILRRPQDDKDGVVDMAYAFVDAWAEQPDPSEASG
jgi:hypothetical protein